MIEVIAAELVILRAMFAWCARTRRTWRLLFAIAALANSGGAIVVLMLLLTGFYE